MILQRAGDDLAGRGRVAVREHDERERRRERRSARRVALHLARARAHRRDLRAVLEEQVADVDRLIDDAAAVAAQVDHDAARALACERLHRVLELLARRLVELEQRQVADLAVEQNRVRHRRDVDHRARELEHDRRGDARPREGDAHLRARISLERVRHLRQLPAVHRLILDRDDVVAVVHAPRFGRRVRIDAAHDRHALLVLDEHAEPGIAPAGARRELGELLGRVERRVRIVDLAYEPARRLFVQIRAGHRVDEAVGDQRQHLIEEARAVARLAIARSGRRRW